MPSLLTDQIHLGEPTEHFACIILSYTWPMKTQGPYPQGQMPFLKSLCLGPIAHTLCPL